ncbi:hypothetical protein ACOSQ3_009848 [Xanthoceras sorbifolium]
MKSLHINAKFLSTQLESESTETESDIWRHSYEFVMQDMFGDMFMSDVEDQAEGQTANGDHDQQEINSGLDSDDNVLSHEPWLDEEEVKGRGVRGNQNQQVEVAELRQMIEDLSRAVQALQRQKRVGAHMENSKVGLNERNEQLTAHYLSSLNQTVRDELGIVRLFNLEDAR